ncbi:hypothetical protein KC19_VG247900 [Ceratodon purpureus]|uniref:Uncharacterized protein n=1 Tax=Ceratodon purpureus TaxID=3225 RepID=A0A8T0HTY8_CERPU|nr:hypothetical protein KC19_VG247900 [Ceratodon purpureus]
MAVVLEVVYALNNVKLIIRVVFFIQLSTRQKLHYPDLKPCLNVVSWEVLDDLHCNILVCPLCEAFGYLPKCT